MLEEIRSGNIYPETIWALNSKFHSVSEEEQKRIESRIDNPDIVRVLTEGEEKDSAYNFSLLFGYEEILFYSLLLEADPDRRQTMFDTFYAEFDSTETSYELNLLAKRGESLPATELDLREWQFQYFLTAFYTRNNNLSSDDFFTEILNVWGERYKSIPVKRDRDFIVSTLTTAADINNQFQVVSNLFEDLMDLEYLPMSRLLRDLYWVADFANYQTNRLDRALYIQRNHTLPLSSYIDDAFGVISIKISQGGYLYQLNNYQEARNVFEEVLEMGDLPISVKASLYNNLSLIYFETGESSLYVDTQMNALNIAKENDNYDQQIRIYRNLHLFYRTNRNWDLAEQYVSEAAELALQTNNLTDLVSIHISKAVFEAQFLGNRSSAHQQLDIAESLMDELDDSRMRIRVLSERSRLHNQEGRWDQSEELQQEIVSLSSSSSSTATYLEALVELANIYTKTDRFEEAASKISEFRTHDISVLNFTVLVKARTIEAEILVNQDLHREAHAVYSDVSDLVFERAQNTSQLETGYWSVEPQYIRLIESYTNFLIDEGDNNRALQLLDRFKTINDASLTDNPLIQANVLTDEQLTEKRNITNEMEQIRNKMFTTTGQERRALQNQVERLSAQRASIVGRSTSGAYNELNIRAIQRKLRSDQMIVHLTEIDSTYYITKVNRNSVEITRKPINSANSELYDEAVHSLITGKTDLNLLYKAGQHFGFDELGSEAASIIFIPDGFFHQLPLSVIPVNPPESAISYGSAEYLVEKVDIRSANSLRDLTNHGRSTARQFDHDFSGFGVSNFNNEATNRNLISLPQAPGEIVSISERLNRLGNHSSMIDESATSDAFRELAGKSRILHLATHSEVSDSDPLFSRLHFYADSESSAEREVMGQLFAYELFDLNLRNDLIMLNSCESGGDRYLQGSGIMGISRALRYAGAQSLILNAWSVNDHFAADFATLFYEHLNDGLSKSKAIQKAKIEFIQGRNANPHYWGAYIMNGDNSPILPDRSQRNGGILLAALLVLGITFSRVTTSQKAA
ncbi:MAG: CHAT domain-containing protein [Balneolaceae bacterium]|nr:CHAT domain-containing protein [Balneolaceae bacterium]